MPPEVSESSHFQNNKVHHAVGDWPTWINTFSGWEQHLALPIPWSKPLWSPWVVHCPTRLPSAVSFMTDLRHGPPSSATPFLPGSGVYRHDSLIWYLLRTYCVWDTRSSKSPVLCFRAFTLEIMQTHYTLIDSIRQYVKDDQTERQANSACWKWN